MRETLVQLKAHNSSLAELGPVLSKVFFFNRLLTYKKEKEEGRGGGGGPPPPPGGGGGGAGGGASVSIETATRRNATVVRWPVRWPGIGKEEGFKATS